MGGRKVVRDGLELLLVLLGGVEGPEFGGIENLRKMEGKVSRGKRYVSATGRTTVEQYPSMLESTRVWPSGDLEMKAEMIRSETKRARG